MVRLLLALALSLLAGTGWARAAQRHFDAAELGTLPVVVPQGEAQAVVFLFSDRAGWTAGLERAARRLAGQGAVVLEVALPDYLERLRHNDDVDCHYLISAIEAASKGIQRELGHQHYLTPILAGTGMGGALAYAALAQAPDATIAGAVSDGLATTLDTRVPLCPGAPATPASGGFSYGPRSELPGWWLLAVAPPQRAAALSFIEGIAAAGLVEVQADASLEERLAAALAERLGGDQAGGGALRELPLVELPAAEPADGPGDLMAVFYSGDGGWRDLDKQISGVLAARGIPTVGVDSLRYFWQEKTPEQVAADLAAILRHYRKAWGRRQAIVLGYSFGAGILPFAVNRLPPAEATMIRQVSLLGLEQTAPFEFHVSGWLGLGPAADERPVLPEIAKLDPTLLQCFFGEDETDSACRAPQFDRAERIETGGGHHFDGDYRALADQIIAGARRRSQG